MSEDANRASGQRSRAGRRSAARMAAVQALYQIELSGGLPDAVLREFREHRLPEELEGLALGDADRELLDDLVRGAVLEQEPLDDMLSAVLAEGWPVERLENLLKVILRAGAYELAFKLEIPARVTITEYVTLTQTFFEGKEPGMANGVLDRLAHGLRPEEFEAGAVPPAEPGAA